MTNNIVENRMRPWAYIALIICGLGVGVAGYFIPPLSETASRISLCFMIAGGFGLVLGFWYLLFWDTKSNAVSLILILLTAGLIASMVMAVYFILSR